MRRHTGCGFKHYVIERRIAEAKLLLRNEPQLKIAAVAEAVGFKSFPPLQSHLQTFRGHDRPLNGAPGNEPLPLREKLLPVFRGIIYQIIFTPYALKTDRQ